MTVLDWFVAGWLVGWFSALVCALVCTRRELRRINRKREGLAERHQRILWPRERER